MGSPSPEETAFIRNAKARSFLASLPERPKVAWHNLYPRVSLVWCAPLSYPLTIYSLMEHQLKFEVVYVRLQPIFVKFKLLVYRVVVEHEKNLTLRPGILT